MFVKVLQAENVCSESYIYIYIYIVIYIDIYIYTKPYSSTTQIIWFLVRATP